MDTDVGKLLRLRKPGESGMAGNRIQVRRPDPLEIRRDQQLPVPGDHHGEDFPGRQSGIRPVEDMEIAGDGPEESQPRPGSEPDVVVRVPVDTADDVGRQTVLLPIRLIPDRGPLRRIEDGDALSKMTYIDLSIRPERETMDAVVQHPFHIGGIEMVDGTGRRIVTVDAVQVGADPDIPLPVLFHVGDFRGGDARFGPVRIEKVRLTCHIVVSAEPGPLGADPDDVGLPVSQHLVQVVSGDDARRLGIIMDGDPVEPVHSLLCPDPHLPVAVDVQGYDEVVGEALSGRQALGLDGHHRFRPEGQGGQERKGKQE